MQFSTDFWIGLNGKETATFGDAAVSGFLERMERREDRRLLVKELPMEKRT
jgi:hypothetical protein